MLQPRDAQSRPGVQPSVAVARASDVPTTTSSKAFRPKRSTPDPGSKDHSLPAGLRAREMPYTGRVGSYRPDSISFRSGLATDASSSGSNWTFAQRRHDPSSPLGQPKRLQAMLAGVFCFDLNEPDILVGSQMSALSACFDSHLHAPPTGRRVVRWVRVST